MLLNNLIMDQYNDVVHLHLIVLLMPILRLMLHLHTNSMDPDLSLLHIEQSDLGPHCLL